mgnify:CR=1 FL=1
MKFSEGLRKGLAIREKLGRPYCAAVIVAAGSSSRMGGTNKILTVLEKLPVICRTVDAFDRCSLIDEIIVVTQKVTPLPARVLGKRVTCVSLDRLWGVALP